MHRTEDLHPVLRGMQADSNTLPHPTPYEYREKHYNQEGVM